MPIYFSESGYGYTYKKNNQRKKLKISRKFFKIIFILSILVLITTCIFTFIFPLFNRDQKTSFLYALQIAEYDDYTSAENMSKNIKQKGGAGYIYVLDKKYKVLISCYRNIEDAEKVKNNLNDSGYQLEIVNLEIKENKSIKSISKEQNEIYIVTQNLFVDNYSQLYDLSVQFDTNSITNNELKTKLNEIYYKNNEIIQKFNDEFNGISDTKIVYLKIYLNRLQQLINNLIFQNSNFDYLIKETYFNVIFLQIDLTK